MLSRTPNKSAHVEEYARELKRASDESTASGQIRIGDLDDTGDVTIQNLKVLSFEAGTIRFSMVVKSNGLFYIFASLNERELKNSITLEVEENPMGEPEPEKLQKSSDQLLKEMKESEDREEKEKEREFMEEKRRQQAEEVKKHEEEMKAKTKERAEANLKQHFMEKKIREMKELQAKKERMDARVGGGYDIDKVSGRKKTDREPVAITREAILPSPVDKNKLRESLRSLNEADQAYSVPTTEPVYKRPSSRQASQYEGLQFSEAMEGDQDVPEMMTPETLMRSNTRPGSSGIRVRDISLKRSSRPASRQTEEYIPESKQHQFDLTESQFLSRNETNDTFKRQPVRAMIRTGDSFHQSGGKEAFTNPEMLMSRDLTESKAFGRVRELYERGNDLKSSLVDSQHLARQDRLDSSQSASRVFKISTPTATKRTASRGISQDKPRGEPVVSVADDKTAPKRSKGGMSLQKKPVVDPYKMPMIGNSAKASPGFRLEKRTAKR